MADRHYASGHARPSEAGHYRPSTGASNPYAQRSTAYGHTTTPYISAAEAYGESASQFSRSDPHYQAAYNRNGSSRHVGGGTPPKRRNRGGLIAGIVVAIIAVAAGVGVYLFLNPPIFDITVNGTKHTVKSGTTIQAAIDQGFASPVAGDLMAVDGSLATKGGGEAFTATVDGKSVTNADYVLHKDDSADISDGGNTDEPYTEATQTIPFSTNSSAMTFSSYYNGSIHIYTDGQDGEQVVRTGSVSGKTVTTVTKQPVSAGYHTYTANVGDDKVIALTFDDGPWSTTSDILDVLKENGAHATFFEIGNQIANYSSVVKRAYDEGNQVCSHSWDHAAGSGQGVNLTYMTAAEQISEMQKGFEAIDSAVGTKVSRVMRAPGGNYYGSLITTLHPYVTAEVGWNIDTEDWKRPGVDSIVAKLLSVKPGQVVLMHDGGGDRSQTLAALKVALPQLVAQGYKFVTVDELIAYGITS